MLVGAIACACFVLQAAVVPLHLALNGHIALGGLAEQAHSHAGDSHGHGAHGHGHEPAQRDDPDGSHPPHPVEDHLSQLAEPAAPPPLVLIVIVPAPAASGLIAFDLQLRVQPHDEERGPGPPPPRTSAAPRAPPIVV